MLNYIAFKKIIILKIIYYHLSCQFIKYIVINKIVNKLGGSFRQVPVRSALIQFHITRRYIIVQNYLKKKRKERKGKGPVSCSFLI